MTEPRAPEDEPIIIASCEPDKNELWKAILRPVFISQILTAQSSPFFNDKCLVIEGRGFGEVVLAAHVFDLEFTAAGTIYHLDDGSGRIKASKDFVSLIHQLPPEVEKHERDQAETLRGTYVWVTGTPSRGANWARITLKSIQPVQHYHNVMFHILNVIYSSMLTEQHIQPYEPDGPRLPVNEETKSYLNDNQATQGDLSPQPQVIHSMPAEQAHHAAPPVNSGLQEISHSYLPSSTAILPSTFTPRKHRPYATLDPLARSIIKYMKHQCEKAGDKNHSVSINEMGQSIQASQRCTEMEFNLAIQMLLSEAYITSPLDDGYVVITPRY